MRGHARECVFSRVEQVIEHKGTQRLDDSGMLGFRLIEAAGIKRVTHTGLRHHTAHNTQNTHCRNGIETVPVMVDAIALEDVGHARAAKQVGEGANGFLGNGGHLGHHLDGILVDPVDEQAVGRIAELIKECDMHPDTVGLIINRAPGGKLNDGIKEEIEKQGLHLLGVVPQDETVYEYDCEGKPTAGLPEDNPVKMALREIVDKLVL